MRTRRRSIARLLLVWYLPACTSYQPTTGLTPQESVDGAAFVKVTAVKNTGGSTGYVVGPDGQVSGNPGTETVRVKDPWVRSDSLGGTPCRRVRNTWRCGDSDAAWAIPLSAVLEISRERTNPVRTAAAVTGIVAVLAAGAGLVALSTMDFAVYGH